jgi:CheY-like chemotaxis protein
MMMPDMDGFALIEHIKLDEQLAGATIMMLTSAGQGANAARCRQLGVGAYLNKPIQQSELFESILTVTGQRREAMVDAPMTAHSPHRTRSLRILLAEDNPVNQRFAVRLLEKCGHQVIVASNGREALALCRTSALDLVLMDVQMPEMDGLEAAAAIRETENSNGKRTPIIALTAHAMKGDMERCLLSGMDGYLSKPIQPAELAATIQRVIALNGRS